MNLLNQVPNGELVDKTIERNFKTIAIERLLLAPMFLLLPVIRAISDQASHYLVNPRDPRAKKEREQAYFSFFFYFCY